MKSGRYKPHYKGRGKHTDGSKNKEGPEYYIEDDLSQFEKIFFPFPR